jgi:shikimate kinase
MATIYLIGFMGSGKSSVGKQLAAKLNYSFVDLDKYIEESNGISINEIFEIKGEKEFRNIEFNALKKLAGTKNTLIACGGGTPCYFDNMELMNSTGITLYINMSAKMLADRLKNSKKERPLVANKNDEDLLDYISKTLEKREYFYTQANYTVKGKNLDVKELVDFLVDKI